MFSQSLLSFTAFEPSDFFSLTQSASEFQGASLTFINQAFPALRMIITVHLFDQQKTAVKCREESV